MTVVRKEGVGSDVKTHSRYNQLAAGLGQRELLRGWTVVWTAQREEVLVGVGGEFYLEHVEFKRLPECPRSCELAVGTHSSRERSGLGAWVQESAAESSEVGALTPWMFKVQERRQRMIRKGGVELREGQGVVGEEMINGSQFNRGAPRIRADKAPWI